jgi:branched-chain amino acid transport system permease protein
LLGVVLDLGLLDATRIVPGWRMVIFGGLVALFLRWRPRGLLDEAAVHRVQQALSRLLRPQGRSAADRAPHRAHHPERQRLPNP